LRFLEFSRNHLATHKLPPGGICGYTLFSGFVDEPPGGWARTARRCTTVTVFFCFDWFVSDVEICGWILIIHISITCWV